MLDGRIMGLDIGDKTIGVAVSDIMGITAQGVKTIRRESKKKDIEELKNIIKERQVNKIVSGLPKNMNGTLGLQGEKVLKLCELIKEETGLEIDFWDERLTTVAAERSLIEGDVSRKKRKKVIDMLAAVIDEDGKEVEFEVCLTLEAEGKEYAILLPLDEESYGDDEDVALVFRIDSDENGDILVPLEDEEEYQIVVDVYNTLMDEEGLNDNEF